MDEKKKKKTIKRTGYIAWAREMTHQIEKCGSIFTESILQGTELIISELHLRVPHCGEEAMSDINSILIITMSDPSAQTLERDGFQHSFLFENATQRIRIDLSPLEHDLLNCIHAFQRLSHRASVRGGARLAKLWIRWGVDIAG